MAERNLEVGDLVSDSPLCGQGFHAEIALVVELGDLSEGPEGLRRKRCRVLWVDGRITGRWWMETSFDVIQGAVGVRPPPRSHVERTW